MAGNGAETRRAIYRTALILTGLTVVEFIIAFTKKYYAEWMGISEDTAQSIVVATFVILTIFKAFYIVAEFMHLRHEVKRLAWTILVPFIFIVWLIIGLISEGTYWGKQASSDKPGSQNSEVVWLG
ncbi:MAG: cytochrome C oxidase subunit IV family protein [Bacteroidia bacterium]|nr:cytochrome C oxidase subunit IV family protein [Bacteroidia bacterium]